MREREEAILKQNRIMAKCDMTGCKNKSAHQHPVGAIQISTKEVLTNQTINLCDKHYNIYSPSKYKDYLRDHLKNNKYVQDHSR